jgi:hypothetical protein
MFTLLPSTGVVLPKDVVLGNGRERAGDGALHGCGGVPHDQP